MPLEKTEDCFAALARVAPHYSLSLHIRQGTPAIVRSTFPERWRMHYGRRHFALVDPVVRWGLFNDGSTSFAELARDDPACVVSEMASFGIEHGAAIAVGDRRSRSLGSIARTDRAPSDDEVREATTILRRLHAIIRQQGEVLTPGQLEALGRISRGQRHAVAAHEIGITESALKARLKSARENLGARTTAEAVRLAQDYGALA